MKSEKVEFVPGNLPIEKDSLLAALQPPSPGAIKGLLDINLQLPETVSPKAKVRTNMCLLTKNYIMK